MFSNDVVRRSTLMSPVYYYKVCSKITIIPKLNLNIAIGGFVFILTKSLFDFQHKFCLKYKEKSIVVL